MSRERKDSLKDLGARLKDTRSEKTFNELYARIRPGLYNYVYQILKNSDDTENVISYTMSYVYNNIDKYKPEWHISTWIYRIAYTAACGEIRAKSKRKETHISDIEQSENRNLISKIEFESMDAYVDVLIDEENKNEADSQILKLQQILDTMPKEYQTVLHEKYFNDLKYEEIAEKLNIPLHTVKNRVSRGKRILESQMIES
jgi:RNA polymerase sigma-70 factor (ECF subfamily)